MLKPSRRRGDGARVRSRRARSEITWKGAGEGASGVVAVFGCWLMLASACALPDDAATVEIERLGELAQPLALDPAFVRPNAPADAAEPARDYTLFEADPVRPVAVLSRSGVVAVTNTVDDYLELFQPEGEGVRRCGSVKVGMRPVAVAGVFETSRSAELWVVNHLSDSISVVSVDTRSCRGEVIATLQVGDEPRDVVVAHTRRGEPRVFVTTAHRGRHHPVASARDASDLVAPPAEKEQGGLADVLVYDPSGRRALLGVVNLFTDTPRALAVGDGVVYAAGFHTGNRTSVVSAERVAERGLESLEGLLSKDVAGSFIERDGELVLLDTARGREHIEGGMPAVVGRGRCLPDPRVERRDRFTQQVCVQTDAEHRVESVRLQVPGQADERCQCTSGDGTLQPTTSVVVQFFDTRQECGAAHSVFPDGSRGCWLDAPPNGRDTAARHRGAQAPAMEWNEQVRFSLPDQDVFAIDVEQLAVRRVFSGVGTILFNMAVQPRTGRVFVTNTEAQNLGRFEGSGASSSSTVRGHLHESRITLIDAERRRVTPVHLNTHIDYSLCCDRSAGEAERSLAFPTGGVFSPDGSDFYFTALGSDKLVRIGARALSEGFDNLLARRSGALEELTLGASVAEPSGPVGLALDAPRARLYVKTHFSNELVVVDSRRFRVLERARLHNPEPASIRRGRHVLYNARLTSAHGDSACASCHVFGNFDSLSWDLGDPAGETVVNPGPYAVTTELVDFSAIAADPFGVGRDVPQSPDFRSNKGPMSTQTLRGLANHGAQHWRGDRTRRFQDAPGQQPDFGTFDEGSSFGEFDVAIVGLNGNDELLEPEQFQDFTHFALQLTLPPNPVRALDDSLTAEQAAARATYFGCASMTEQQFAERECVAQDGEVVDVDAATRACACQRNSFVTAIAELPDVLAFARALKAALASEAAREQLALLAGDTEGLPESERARHAQLVSALGRAAAELSGARLDLDVTDLLEPDAALSIANVASPMTELLALSERHHTPSGGAVLAFLAPLLPAEVGALPSVFARALEVSNVNLRVWQDEQARGTGAFRDLLQGCDVSAPSGCRLRVTDSFQTCHGCHTLDPAGNAEFDVYRPGFFGTDGKYSFENESQVLKVPHLRNLYQKVGMFGLALGQFFPFQSVLGPRRGGFMVEDPDATEHTGPQVRGFGFQRDGSSDTLHRFHGTVLFVARPQGNLGPADPGNPDGFDVVLPEPASRQACVASFQGAPAAALESFPAVLRPALNLCLAASPIPERCFVDPDALGCTQVLQALGLQIGDGDFPATFASQLRPLCFQLGSMLEGGAPSGQCAPEGLEIRAQMESFMLAFDSNLKPMVGQQVTISDLRAAQSTARELFRAAARGHCDLAARQGRRGYLVTEPRFERVLQSRLESAKGRRFELGDLSSRSGPITFTCHPPQPERAEARRSAFDAGRVGRH